MNPQASTPAQGGNPNSGQSIDVSQTDNVSMEPDKPPKDAEEAGCCDFDFTPDKSFEDGAVRQGFIRKVFSIVFAQLLLTSAIVAVFLYVKEVRDTFIQNTWIIYLCIGLQFVVLLTFCCAVETARIFPLNMIIVFFYTTLEGFCLGVITIRFSRGEVLLALLITVAITGSVVAFALQTKYDFTMMWGLMLSLTMALLIGSILIAILGTSKIVGIIFSSFGALVFSMWLLIDVQTMMTGKQFQISPEDYVLAALNIYIDIICIFLRILEIIERSRE